MILKNIHFSEEMSNKQPGFKERARKDVDNFFDARKVVDRIENSLDGTRLY